MSSNVQRGFLVLIVAAVGLGGCSSGSSSEADLTTAPAEAAPSPQLDVAYADTAPEQRLDLYQPAPADKPAPLVIYIHGGAWRTGDKGIVTASIHRQPRRSLRAAPTSSRFRCLT